jgi:hypothetical protein
MFTHQTGLKLTGATKIYVVPHPDVFNCKKAYIGFAGGADTIGRVMNWLYDPSQKPPRVQGVEMLVLTDRGKIMHGSSVHSFTDICDPHFSIGSGMAYAQAAMAAGKDPLEAVKIAAKYDVYTGGPFTKMNME